MRDFRNILPENDILNSPDWMNIFHSKEDLEVEIAAFVSVA